jgi:hypothetical protein
VAASRSCRRPRGSGRRLGSRQGPPRRAGWHGPLAVVLSWVEPPQSRPQP